MVQFTVLKKELSTNYASMVTVEEEMEKWAPQSLASLSQKVKIK